MSRKKKKRQPEKRKDYSEDMRVSWAEKFAADLEDVAKRIREQQKQADG